MIFNMFFSPHSKNRRLQSDLSVLMSMVRLAENICFLIPSCLKLHAFIYSIKSLAFGLMQHTYLAVCF